MVFAIENAENITIDGIVDEKAYSNQKFRLAFLLKETNGNTPDGKVPDHYQA